MKIKKLSKKIAVIVSTSVLSVSIILCGIFQIRIIDRINAISSLDLSNRLLEIVEEGDLAFAEVIYKTAGMRSLAESQFNADEYIRNPQGYFDNTIRPAMEGYIHNIVARTYSVFTAYFAVHPDLSGRPIVNEIFFEMSGYGIIPGEPQTYEEYMQVNSEEMEWFYGAYNSRQPYWTTVYWEDGDAMISYVEPVVIGGVTVGVVGTDILLDHLEGIISDFTVYDTGFAVLKGVHGEVVITPATRQGSLMGS